MSGASGREQLLKLDANEKGRLTEMIGFGSLATETEMNWGLGLACGDDLRH